MISRRFDSWYNREKVGASTERDQTTQPNGEALSGGGEEVRPVDLVFFHSERGRKLEDSDQIGLRSPNLIDFFLEVAGRVSSAVVVLPRAHGELPVSLTLPSSTQVLEVPFPSNASLRELTKCWQMLVRLSGRGLRRKLQTSRYSVSVGLSFFGTAAGLIRIVLVGKPHCFIIRGNRPRTVRASSRSKIKKLFILARLFLYRRVIETAIRSGMAEAWFQGSSSLEEFSRSLGTHHSGRLRILNAVLRELPSFYGRESRWAKASADVVFVGHLHREKGVFDLVEAVRRIKLAGEAITVRVIGDGVDGEEMLSAVERAGLSDWFDFLGYVAEPADLAAAVSSSRLFVLPSHTEGMPRAMVEAMYLGVPILATSVGGIPSIISDGRNGFLVRDRDPDALAQKILFALNPDTQEDLANIIENARELARTMAFPAKAVEFIRMACR